MQVGLPLVEEAAVLGSRHGWNRGTKATGCVVAQVGSKASVRSCESREGFASVCLLREYLGMDHCFCHPVYIGRGQLLLSSTSPLLPPLMGCTDMRGDPHVQGWDLRVYFAQPGRYPGFL